MSTVVALVVVCVAALVGYSVWMRRRLADPAYAAAAVASQFGLREGETATHIAYGMFDIPPVATRAAVAVAGALVGVRARVESQTASVAITSQGRLIVFAPEVDDFGGTDVGGVEGTWPFERGSGAKLRVLGPGDRATASALGLSEGLVRVELQPPNAQPFVLQIPASSQAALTAWA
jgi:hypothetical protein